MDVQKRIEVLRKVDAFARLPEPVLRALADRLAAKDVAVGTVLMKQGDQADGLWVIGSGLAEVRLRKAGKKPILLARPGPSTVLGEMALITQGPRLADVVMTEAGTALFLSRADFEALERRMPEIVSVLTELVAQRLGRAAEDGLGDKVLDGYRIVRPVGRGATAVVYEAERVGVVPGVTADRVALKMLSHRLVRDQTAMAWFEREASVLERLRHPGIASCHGRFPAYGTRFLVIDYVDGPSLGEVVRRIGALPEADARRAVGSIAKALAHVHAHGVLHGDIKPANVLVGLDGHVRLTDFGIATAMDEAASSAPRPDTLRLSGTPRYMAPEMFLGAHRSEATDIYALGCVLWEVLAGRPAFPMEDIGGLVLAKRRFDAEAARDVSPTAPADLVAALAGFLDPDPSARTGTLASLAAEAGDISQDVIARVVAARSAA